MKRIGIVKWFNSFKGYGFIKEDGEDAEIFVHYSAIEGNGYRNLRDGDKVSFDKVDAGKGAQAKNVRANRYW